MSRIVFSVQFESRKELSGVWDSGLITEELMLECVEEMRL